MACFRPCRMVFQAMYKTSLSEMDAFRVIREGYHIVSHRKQRQMLGAERSGPGAPLLASATVYAPGCPRYNRRTHAHPRRAAKHSVASQRPSPWVSGQGQEFARRSGLPLG
jgi:hypothetical protein